MVQAIRLGNRQPQRTRSSGLLLYGLLYFATSLVGLQLSTMQGGVSPVWYAAGVGLAATLTYGWRALPLIYLMILADLLLYGIPIRIALANGFGPVAEAALGYWMIRRVVPDNRLFRSATRMAWFLMFGVMLAPLASALIGNLSLMVFGVTGQEHLAQGIFTWWLGDATGVLLLTPLLLQLPFQGRAPWNGRILELSSVILALLLSSGLAFGPWLPESIQQYPLTFLLVPPMVWTVLRFGRRITCLLLLLVSLLAISGSYLGYGAFARGSAQGNILLLQIYIGIMSATLLLARAALEERDRSIKRLSLASKVIENTPDGVLVTDHQGIILSANPAFLRHSGLHRQMLIGQSAGILNSGYHDPDFFQRMWHQLERQGQWQGEVWNRNSNNEILPEWLSIRAVRDRSNRITHYVGIYSELARQRHRREQVSRLAYYDPLTNLPNRQLFNDRLEQALKYADRQKSELALMFLDLDRFKNINDTLGHSSGDQVLSEVAKRLSTSVRETDTLARLGGDEFTVILQDLKDPQDASQVARKILDAFRTHLTIHEHELFLTPSIGIAIYPGSASNRDELIKQADTAMYSAKEQGGNTFEFYNSDMGEPLRWNLEVENRLRRAIEMKAVTLYYQPQFDLQTGALIGLESLARWDDPQLGRIPPTAFIQVAETSGLIHPLGESLLRQAAAQTDRWAAQGLTGLSVAVNVSPLQLRQQDFVTQLERIVAGRRSQGNRLELEITETSLMENAKFMEQLLSRLTSLGVEIAVDDFGTGYSSLSYLKRLSLTRLKIDRTFIQEVPENSNDGAICRAIIAMAHSLGLRVLAEGVENDQQMEFLRREGCDEMQGFLLSKPLRADEVGEMLSQGYWHTR